MVGRENMTASVYTAEQLPIAGPSKNEFVRYSGAMNAHGNAPDCSVVHTHAYVGV